MEPPEKILWFSQKLTKKTTVLKTLDYLQHSTPGISENARKKVNIFQDISLKNFNSIEIISFNLQKFNITLRYVKNCFILEN